MKNQWSCGQYRGNPFTASNWRVRNDYTREIWYNYQVTARKGQHQKLTDDEKYQIISRYQAGETYDPLVRDFNRSYRTIRQVLIGAGVPVNDAHKRIVRPSNEEAIEIAARYAEGDVKLGTLAAELPYSKKVIRETIESLGIPMRTSKFAPLTVIEKNDIAQRYSNGATFMELCAEYHRNKLTLKAVLAEYGILVRVWDFSTVLAQIHKYQNDSPIEKALQDELRAAGICFIPHTQIGTYTVDIELCQAPIIIEADGVAHLIPVNVERDKIRDRFVVSQGCRVFRFTSTKIKKSAKACIQQVIDECDLQPDICQIMI